MGTVLPVPRNRKSSATAPMCSEWSDWTSNIQNKLRPAKDLNGRWVQVKDLKSSKEILKSGSRVDEK